MKMTVLESAGVSSTAVKSFENESQMLAHVIARARTYVLPAQAGRFEKAVIERIVSEDGEKAVSEVVAGTVAFAKALVAAYAPQISIVTKAYGKDDSEED
jgi:hypothetical protein